MTGQKPFAGLRVADFAWVGWDRSRPSISLTTAPRSSASSRARTPRPYGGSACSLTYRASIGPGTTRTSTAPSSALLVNLKHPRGPELMRRLIATCDVVTESFTPGTLARFGLDWASLSKDRDDLLMISMPSTARPGRGPVHGLRARPPGSRRLQPPHGLAHGPPTSTGIAYIDFLSPTSPQSPPSARLPSLHRKRNTSNFGQMEAAIHGLGTAASSTTANAIERRRAWAIVIQPQRRTAATAPWITSGSSSLARRRSTERGPRRRLRPPDWCDLERTRRRLGPGSGSRRNRPLLAGGSKTSCRDDEPAEVPVEGQEGIFVRRLTSRELMEHMQRHGVPAGLVQSAADVHHDPQLAHRKHFRKPEHLVMGLRSYDSPAFKLSKTPAELDEGRPLPRADNEYVYRELIGLAGR